MRAIPSGDTGIRSVIHFSSFRFRHSFYYSALLFHLLSVVFAPHSYDNELPQETASLPSAVIHKALASAGIEISYLTLKSRVKTRSYVITSNNTKTSVRKSCSKYCEEVPLNI